MLRMLGSINDHLDEIEPSGGQRVNMWRHTCHRPGLMVLAEELGQTYRQSGNVWDSLAEAHLKAGDSEQATIYYEKSLELNPNKRNAKAMLDQINSQP